MQRGVHPDVVEFAPGGASYRVQGRRPRRDPSRSGAGADRSRSPRADPVRGRAAARQPERVGQRDAEDDRGAAAAHDRAARHRRAPTTSCRRSAPAASASTSIPVADDALRAALERDGVDPGDRGDRGRARRAVSSRAPVRFAGPLAPMRAAFADAPARVDGTGATAFAVAEELGAAVDQAADAVTSRHERGAAGVRRRARAPRVRRPRRADAAAAGSRSATSARSRRTRIDLLLEGVTVIESVYRDALADPAPPLNRDRPRLVVAPARGRARSTRAAKRVRRS